MDRGAWWATVYGVAQSWTQLSNLACTCSFLSEKKMPLLNRYDTVLTDCIVCVMTLVFLLKIFFLLPCSSMYELLSGCSLALIVGFLTLTSSLHCALYLTF